MSEEEKKSLLEHIENTEYHMKRYYNSYLEKKLLLKILKNVNINIARVKKDGKLSKNKKVLK